MEVGDRVRLKDPRMREKLPHRKIGTVVEMLHDGYDCLVDWDNSITVPQNWTEHDLEVVNNERESVMKRIRITADQADALSDLIQKMRGFDVAIDAKVLNHELETYTLDVHFPHEGFRIMLDGHVVQL